MNIVASIMLWVFPALLVLALVVGLAVCFAVRSREKRRRAEFHRAQAQAAHKRSQEKELEKMKIDDL